MQRAIFVFILCSVLPLRGDDDSSFTPPPDATWQRFDPLGIAAYHFIGGQCHITCPLPTSYDPNFLPFPRATLIAPTVFAETSASVDLTAWLPTTNRSIDGEFPSVLTRIQSPATIGNLGGYGLSIIDLGGGTAQLQIHKVVGEYPILVAGPANFPLSQTKDYRLVLSSRGSTHIGSIFDLSNPGTPIVTIIGEDCTYAAGRTGISISTDRAMAVDVTFDEFLAWDGTPPPLLIQRGVNPDTIEILCDARRAMTSRLETTADLTQVEDLWTTAFPASSTRIGNLQVDTLLMDGPTRFYRRKSF